MARVTVEDCVEKVSSRFELVMLAAQRARKIGSGAQLTVARDNDKNPVIALREIAESTVAVDVLREEMVTSHQRFLPQDEEEEKIDLMDGEKEWSAMAQTASSGIYADEGFSADDEDDEDEDFDDEDDSDPSLGDIAGV